jgi:Brp/Blh family beta-carotene 15,15'-monooxygenase
MGTEDLAKPVTSTGTYWYPQWRFYHTYVASFITLIISVAAVITKAVGYKPNMTVEIVLLLICVSLFGIPHGASDHVVVAEYLYARFRRLWLPVFLVVYLGLVGAVLLFWWMFPVFALGCFLMTSIVHFGLGDVEQRLVNHSAVYWMEVITRGSMIILIPCVYQRDDVNRIFSWLVGDSSSHESVELFLYLVRSSMPVWYVSMVLIGWYHNWAFMKSAKHDLGQVQQGEGKSEDTPKKKSPTHQHYAIVVEMFSLYTLFAAVTPLVAFIVYFCVWHSVRHNLMVATTSFNQNRAGEALYSFFWASVPFTLCALAMGYVGFTAMQSEEEDQLKHQLRLVFVGLNALTVPHMLMIELSELRKRAASGQCANFIGLCFGADLAHKAV